MRRFSLVPSLFALAPVWAAPTLPAEGQAQAATVRSTGSLEVTVRGGHERQPLGGAQVLVSGLGSRGVTDSRGFLRIAELPYGRRTIEVRYLGYATVQRTIPFAEGATTRVTIDLEPQPIRLAEVRVRVRESTLALRGFEDRRRSGQGTFLTRQEIERRNPGRLSDVFRQVGVQVRSDAWGQRATGRMRGQQTISGPCPIQYFVDGVLTSLIDIDEIRPSDVEGLEIYRGASTIPTEFKRGTAMCGVVLIWTRLR